MPPQRGAGDDGHPDRAHLDVMLGSWKAWGELPGAGRSGEGHPALRVYNEDNPLTAQYVRWSTAARVVPAQDFMTQMAVGGERRLIAGTVGGDLVNAVREAKPDAEVTSACLPQLIEQLPTALEHWQGPEPSEVIANSGDAEGDQWGKHEAYDLVLLARKVADCGPDHAVSYLRKAKRVIPEDGLLVVWEPLRENWAMIPGQPERLALTDMMMGEGHPLYRKSEIADHMRDAGFTVDVHDVMNGLSTFFVGSPRVGKR